MKEAMKLTLISRTYCHLCHDMEVALAPLANEFGIGIEVQDVDADPKLEACYTARVPVLLHDETELCHYFLDYDGVRDYLTKLR